MSILTRSLALPGLLLLASCVGKKDFTVNTYPQGAAITINGEPVGTSPVTTEIAQDKDLSILALKPGYEAASETVPTQTNTLLAIIWTKRDPYAQYIEPDEVTIPLKKIPTPASYTPTKLPAYRGAAPAEMKAEQTPPEMPALRPLPDFD